jgi:hypothetical protein
MDKDYIGSYEYWVTLRILENRKPNTTIKQLKKGDNFKFNYDIFKVTRKWLDDDRPLIAIEVENKRESRFDWEGLEVEKIELEVINKPDIIHG